MLPNDISQYLPGIAHRYWAKVAIAGPDDCWPWTAYCSHLGYGKFGTPDGVAFAHRVGWTLAFGPIPDGLRVLHKCDNRPCQNFAHFFLGTQGDNVQDMWDKHRHPTPSIIGRRYITGDEHWTRSQSEKVRRGDGHPRSKLTAAIVQAARNAVAEGESTVPELARRYGVAIPVMRRAIIGKTWRHVR